MTYKASARDRVVIAVANWIVRTFGTHEYNTLLKAIVVAGLAAPSVEDRMIERFGDALQTPPDELTVPEFRKAVIKALKEQS